ncbi:MAG: hypothetical protein QMD25_05035 [Caldisericia bacterium]|jgi:hypothetical protein|nr:hypothetical protein [Caldisericia bacterium]
MDRKSLIKDIERIRNSKVLVYFLGPKSNIAQDAVEVLFNHLRIIGKVEKLDLFLHTFGGILEIPPKIVSIMREFSNHFSVLIPYRAHSAGTLIAIGADEIVMGKMAELTPVDPQTRSPLNPKDPKGEITFVAVQDLISFFKFVDTVGVEKKEEILKSLLENLHPLVIGTVNRSWSLIKHIMNRLLTHSNYTNEEKEKIIELLSGGLPSHNYLITRDEAKEILKEKVVFASEELDRLMWDLYIQYMILFNPNVPFIFDSQFNREVKKVNIASIETLNSLSLFIQIFDKKVEDGKIIEVPIAGGWFDFK